MELSLLTETQKTISELAEDFAKKEIIPRAAEYDQKAVFPKDVLRKALERGLINLGIPEEYGGAGLGCLDFILVTEKLAWACAGITGAISLNSMIAGVLLVAGNDAQKKKYLTELLNGKIASYALTEPAAGSDVEGIQAAAVKKGDGYVISGSKTWISNAPHADFFVVFAKTDMALGKKGISCFILDKDTKGLEVGKNLDKLGQKAFPAAEVFFNDVHVPDAQLLGKPGDGFMIAMKVFDRSRPMVGALGVGISQRCLDESLGYAKKRESKGKFLVQHQLVGAKIAEMGMRTQAARLLAYQAADLIDHGKQNTLHASYAKTFASDTAVWASSEAIQVFGGMGYSKEYPVEKLYRDSKVLQIYEGANEIQRLIMARELSKDS